MAFTVPRRPRWGAFSVRAHIDPFRLIPDILLFDRLLLPVPDDDEEEGRWQRQGWEPEEQAQRIVQLGDLVHTMPWDQTMRDRWQARWDRLKAVGRETEALAYGETPNVIAMTAWEEIANTPSIGDVPGVRPLVIAAYQSAAEAEADFDVTHRRGMPGRRQIDREVAALFRRELAMPVPADDPEEAFHRAVHLAHQADFQRAREALFEWEDQIVAQQYPLDDAIAELERAVSAYDEFVQQTFRQTRKRNIFRLVSLGAGPVAGMIGGNPLAGAGASVVVNVVEAMFPSFLAPSRGVDDHPGAALNQALSALYRD